MTYPGRGGRIVVRQKEEVMAPRWSERAGRAAAMAYEEASAHIVVERIIAIRLSLNLTKAEFAESLGVNVNTVKAWENGRAFPSLRNMIRVCRVYDIEWEYLDPWDDADEEKE